MLLFGREKSISPGLTSQVAWSEPEEFSNKKGPIKIFSWKSIQISKAFELNFISSKYAGLQLRTDSRTSQDTVQFLHSFLSQIKADRKKESPTWNISKMIESDEITPLWCL